MEPLPSVNKAFSMVTRVEKLMDVQIQLNGESNSAALLVRSQTSCLDTRIDLSFQKIRGQLAMGINLMQT